MSFNCHKSDSFCGLVIELVRDLQPIDNDGIDGWTNVPGVYVITVEQADKYAPFLAKVDNWRSELRVLYIGEAKCMATRLKKHKKSIENLVSVATEAGSKDLRAELFGFHVLPVAEAPSTAPPVRRRGEGDGDDRTLPERLAIEGVLTAAIRPVAAQSGFGGGTAPELDAVWKRLKDAETARSPASTQSQTAPLLEYTDNGGLKDWLASS